ncbi:MAG: NapC/NirT family cytochrome c, partial [Chromatiaceae bacterium]
MARFLAAIPISRPIFLALILGGLGGMLFMVFLLEFDHYSSTNEFCTSCHSMTYVEEEYQKSVHYNPVSGVRAECGDCHVSTGVFAATWDHIKGGKDLWKQLFGANYDDPVVNALHLPEAA